MADVLTPSQRSFCMSRVRGKNTKPEILLRRGLWSRGLRYRLSRKLFGRPDITFVGARIVVFVDGCFWHGCPDHGSIPKTNSEFWSKKITKTIHRDLLVNSTLEEEGWLVLRFWEHQIKNDLEGCVNVVKKALK